MLRHPEVGGVEDAELRLGRKPVADPFEGGDQSLEDARVTALGHPWHVLHDEVARPQLGHETEEMEHQLVALVVDEPLADQREALTRRPSGDEIELAVPKFRIAAVTCQTVGDRPTQRVRFERRREVGAQRLGVRKVERVYGRVHWVVLDRGDDIESRLLQPER